MNGTAGVNVIVVPPIVRHVPGTLGTMLGRAELCASTAENLTEIGAAPPTLPAPLAGVVDSTRSGVELAGSLERWRCRVALGRDDNDARGGAEAAALGVVRWIPA